MDFSHLDGSVLLAGQNASQGCDTRLTQTARSHAAGNGALVRALLTSRVMDYRKIGRRDAIGMLGAASAALAFGCSGDTPTNPATTTTTTSTGSGSSSSSCAVTPTETIGPYPSLTDLIRSDIREGKSGTPVALAITVVNVNASCSPVANAKVEIWQCDAAGTYSEYGTQRAESYLRGIQITNPSGEVTFTTIYPGWYQGRATHIHAEVTLNGASVKVTQIAFPESVSAAVYATGVYASRGSNPTTNANDNVFSDGVASELATLTGNPASGYTATFRIGIAV
jgi:protocatechuate 3,4-dioxygenase beta subunit